MHPSEVEDRLSTKRKEYLKEIVHLMRGAYKKSFIEFFKSVKSRSPKKYVLRDFQDFLRSIPKWDKDQLFSNSVHFANSIDRYMILVKKVCKVSSDLYGTNEWCADDIDSKLMHACFVDIARHLFRNPLLVYDDIETQVYLSNLEKLEKIIHHCIKAVMRNMFMSQTSVVDPEDDLEEVRETKDVKVEDKDLETSNDVMALEDAIEEMADILNTDQETSNDVMALEDAIEEMADILNTDQETSNDAMALEDAIEETPNIMCIGDSDMDKVSNDVKELEEADNTVEKMTDILDETSDDVKELDHVVKETTNIFKLDQAPELDILDFECETSNNTIKTLDTNKALDMDLETSNDARELDDLVDETTDVLDMDMDPHASNDVSRSKTSNDARELDDLVDETTDVLGPQASNDVLDPQASSDVMKSSTVNLDNELKRKRNKMIPLIAKRHHTSKLLMNIVQRHGRHFV